MQGDFRLFKLPGKKEIIESDKNEICKKKEKWKHLTLIMQFVLMHKVLAIINSYQNCENTLHFFSCFFQPVATNNKL